MRALGGRAILSLWIIRKESCSQVLGVRNKLFSCAESGIGCFLE
jgi:hypothetical protein